MGIRTIVATVACALALAAPTAHATPGWLLPSQPLSDPAHAAQTSATTMGPNGDIAAVWAEKEAIAMSVRPPGAPSTGRTAISLPGAFATSPGVAVNAKGEVLAAWQELKAHKYEASIRPPGGSFSAPTEVISGSTNSSFVTSVALDNAGDALIGTVTLNGTNTASYAWRPAGGTFSTVSLSGFSANATAPAVAMDEAGDAIVAWAEQTGKASYVVRVVRRPAGGSFGSAETLSDSSGNSFEPAVAMGAGGKAAVVWTHNDGAHYRIQASMASSAGGLLSTPQTISRAGADGEYPAIAVSAGGEVVAAWTEAGTGEVAGGTVDGSFGPVTDLRTSSGELELAIDDAGNAIVAWGDFQDGSAKLAATIRSAAGAVSPPQILSGSGDTLTVFANVPTAFVGMDRVGDGIAGWTRTKDSTVQSSVYDATGPALVPSVPASATARQPVSFAAAANDLFSPLASIKWSFGDGGTAEGATPSHTYASPGSYTVVVTASDGLANTSSASSQIAVAAAPVVKPQPLPVTVKCVVPKLKGSTKAAAKRRLLAVHCKLGKVTISKRYRHAKRLVVSSQGSKAGRQLAAGASVSITLAPPPKPKLRKRHR